MNKYILFLIVLLSAVAGNAQISDVLQLSKEAFVIEKDTVYDHVLWEGSYIGEPGSPKLPVVRKSFVVPQEAKVTGVTVSMQGKQKINESIYIYPEQEEFPVSAKEWKFTEPNPLIYKSSVAWPNKQAEVVEDRFIHGYHIVTIALYPLEYVPASGELYLYNFSYQLNYTVSPSTKRASEKQSVQSPRRANLTRSFVESIVENPNSVSNHAPTVEVRSTNKNATNSRFSISQPVEKDVPIDYIIITSESLKEHFQPLANWKTKKGTPAIIETTEYINANFPGSDLAEKIRNYLMEAEEKWGAGLFVLLGGDTNIIPARMVQSYYKGQKYPADLYFVVTPSAFDWNIGTGVFNSPYSTNFFLGRAPVENQQEAEVFVDKVLVYEKMANTGGYLNNFLAADAYLSKSGNTLHSDRKHEIDTILQNNLDESKHEKWYLFDHFNCQCANHHKNYDTTSGAELNKNSFYAALNDGGSSGLGNFHLIYHMDHSHTTAMGTCSYGKSESVTNSDISALTNAPNYHIMMSGGCHPANFAQDCIAEQFLNNPNGGAVAFIGNTDVGWREEWAQYGYFVREILKNTDYTIGSAFLKSTLGTSMNSERTKWRLHLLGDPEMPVWTASPQDLDVTIVQDSMVLGTNEITIKINSVFTGSAQVCLMKGSEDYVVYTIEDNQPHTISFTPRIRMGDVDVTITAHNYRPYETTIPMVSGTYLWAQITHLAFDDDNLGNSVGNGDGQLDAGETIELMVVIERASNSYLINPIFDAVTATLRCSHPDIIELVDSTMNFGNLTPEQSYVSSDKCVFTINKDAEERLKTDMNAVTFYLDITDPNGAVSPNEFKVDIFAPDIKIGNQTVISTYRGSNVIDRNMAVILNIDLMNVGKAEATGVSAKLTTSSPYVSLCPSTPRRYPTIGKYETKTNIDTYQFMTSSSYTPGASLVFTLEITNEYGRTWLHEFDLTDRPSPVSVDMADVRCWPYPTEIEIHWTAPSGASGYNIYRSNDDEDDPYVKLNTFPLPNAFFRDTGLSEFTPYYYKISAISPSGNESALSDPLKTGTSYNLTGLFPIAMDHQMRYNGGINAIDVDGDGKMEIFAGATCWNTNQGYLVGLNHEGHDLYDIDDNVTTPSGFARFPMNIWGTPALGDIDGDGEIEVVVGGRVNTNNKVYCYSTMDNNGDGRPDLRWSESTLGTYYTGPVLANIDGSTDGSMEIVLFDNEKANSVIVLDNEGEEFTSLGSNLTGYAAPAVADLDGDGDMEIILGSANHGIHIWHHNGNSFTASNPFYQAPSGTNYRMDASPVVCDLDGDGEKEILIAVREYPSGDPHLATTAKVLAFNLDSTFVSGWDESQTISVSNAWHPRNLSVGDINGDGNLEVVILGQNMVKAWKHTGQLLFQRAIPLFTPLRGVPILADVDGETDCEIIFATEENGHRLIYALKPDGSDALGFPIPIDLDVYGSVCVADVDDDGYNELIVGATYMMYAWKTLGSPNRIEWGSERHNPQNTGEYPTSTAISQRNANRRAPIGSDADTSIGQSDSSILYQNTPNPFSRDTEIGYRLGEGALTASIHIYNLTGEQLAIYTLNTNQLAGSVTISTSDLDAGMYIYTLQVNDQVVDSKKMTLTK